MTRTENQIFAGREGNSFPAGMKPVLLPKDIPKPKYRSRCFRRKRTRHLQVGPLLEMDPWLIEGMIYRRQKPSGSHQGYIYAFAANIAAMLRIILEAAIADVYTHGYLGKNILGSGFTLICARTPAPAHTSAARNPLMESLEGKRGYPRIRPPFPAVVGLYGCPTVINNAETLSSVPSVILRGGEWYAGLGSPKNGGTRLFAISGHVNRPGIYELPMGFNLKRMIEAVAGGVLGGKKLKL